MITPTKRLFNEGLTRFDEDLIQQVILGQAEHSCAQNRPGSRARGCGSRDGHFRKVVYEWPARCLFFFFLNLYGVKFHQAHPRGLRALDGLRASRCKLNAPYAKPLLPPLPKAA